MRLDTQNARTRFADSQIARLATVRPERGAPPHLVPVTFALSGRDKIVIGIDHKPKSTTDLQRLRNISTNPQVSLLADEYHPDWTRLWWCRADGEAHLITEGDAHAHAWEALRARYPQYAGRILDGPVIEVTVRRWTGWTYQ